MSLLLNPYLSFSGQARDAMTFYQTVLGGELKMQSFAEVGTPTPEEYKDKIMHADLKTDWCELMASDGAPGMTVNVGDNVSISVSGTDDATLTNIYNKLSEGGKVTLPLEKAPWGDKFGMLTDKFGVHWMVNISASQQ